MKNNIEEIDKLIKETLTKEEAKFYDELDEQNILQMVLGLFKGKNKWIMLLMNFMTLIFFALFIYCVVEFFETDIQKEYVKWAIGALFFFLVMSMLKMYVWMQMDKNAILRELKRLEILVTSKS
jgi:hypothetical protein